MNKKKSTGSVSIGLADIFLVVFVVLKLVGVIKWSWFWVLSPIWIPLLIVLICAIIFVLLD